MPITITDGVNTFALLHDPDSPAQSGGMTPAQVFFQGLWPGMCGSQKISKQPRYG
jgi:hypothetical protein